jgi:hypothetical protein
MGSTECVYENDRSSMSTATTISQTEGCGGSGERPCLERTRYLRNIVRGRNSSGKSGWYNKKYNVWFDEASATWKPSQEPTPHFDGATLQNDPRNTERSVRTSPAAPPQAIPINNYEGTQRRSIPFHRKALFWSVRSRDTFVNRFQKRQKDMLTVHISHLRTFGQENTCFHTTHLVPTYKLIGHLFILHTMEGGVAPRPNIALVQQGVLNDHGEWVVLDTKVEPYHWNPLDETSVMNAGWHLSGNQLWLALIST